MKIHVPLSPFFGQWATPLPSQATNSIANENEIPKEIKRLSFSSKSLQKMETPGRIPFSDLANGQRTISPVKTKLKDPTSENEPIRLFINVQDVSDAVVEAKSAHLRETISALHHQLAMIEAELAEERAQHDQISASLRRDCASLRDALTDAEKRAAANNTESSVETPMHAKQTIQQLREELAAIKRSETALLSTIYRLKLELKVKEEERTSLAEYLAFEKDIEAKENEAKSEYITSLETALAEARKEIDILKTKAAAYDQDRHQAASNVVKAEREVDILAEEHVKMYRQLKYVQNRLAAHTGALDHAAPAVSRLARELSHFLENNPENANGSVLGGDGDLSASMHTHHHHHSNNNNNMTTLNTNNVYNNNATNNNTMMMSGASRSAVKTKTPLTALRGPLRNFI